MDIENLTYAQIKKILSVFGSAANSKTTHPFVGKYVIARCYAAGVHAGKVVSVDGENAILENSRRLWSWKAKSGVALSGVAQTGLESGCNIDVINPEIALTGVCEIIPCSDIAMESINEYKD